ncbi:DNA repair protein RecO [Virgibacillus halodenitrificans]|uniref:DNA repair protein RecO n=1 Tax=Virgibacillus halodenitrificans TaxID=1482 RepID=UPI000EF5164C|nr:DNA repair protein RecO [Virgibacillus halodenitrificans]
MKSIKLTGIVLRSSPYGETHKIVTLYTKEQGKIALFAHGAKKAKGKLAGITQLFTEGYFLVNESPRGGMGTLKQGETINRYKNIQLDLVKTTYASCIAELIDRLTEEGVVDTTLYEILSYSLQYMNDNYNPRVITAISETKLLPYAGINLQLNGCNGCGGHQGMFRFSVREGGFICNQCFHKDTYALPVSSASIRIFLHMYYMNINVLGKVSVREQTIKDIENILKIIYDDNSGIILKSKKLIKDIQKFQQTIFS